MGSTRIGSPATLTGRQEYAAVVNMQFPPIWLGPGSFGAQAQDA